MHKISALVLLVCAAVIAAFALIVLRHGFPFGLMDLNDDGLVSPLEIIASLDLGHRTVEEGSDEGCVEIFNLKDGLPIKTVCRDQTE